MLIFHTQSGQKIGTFLEEAGLPYQAHTIDIRKGEQFTEEFLKISVRPAKILLVVRWLVRLFDFSRAKLCLYLPRIPFVLPFLCIIFMHMTDFYSFHSPTTRFLRL